MAADEFDDQFAALVGYKPFRWQRRLFECFVGGELPAALDLPTGLGKTSVMAIWLIARAHGAKLPRRLVYVVDRRAVVDQATEEAEKLASGLGKGGAPLEVIATLRDGLRLERDRGMPISTLRGQFVDNRDWLADPAATAIVVGTVDMIGSRLLFAGYGVSRKMRPYHAGLLGADALVVPDEAHLVPPFEKLLEAVEAGGHALGPRSEKGRDIIPSFRLLSLSATGRPRQGTIFWLDEADPGDEIVKKRLTAAKALEFVEAGNQKLEDALAGQAWLLADKGAANIRCLVYCDSRDTAEATEKAIRRFADGDKRNGVAKTKIETELFVGARRVKEREDAKNWLARHGLIAGSDAPRERPAFLIATSAGEVGVDLDAEHMVCDVVPWERMVQRLGRVNRRGDGNARINLVDAGEPKPKKPEEPTAREKRDIVAHRVLALIAELPNTDGRFDASPGALRDLKLRAGDNEELQARIDAASTPAPLRPALTRALIDAWSMTSLEEHSGRPDDIGPWLRGWIEDDEPHTTIVWRKFLPARTDGGDVSPKEIEAFFEAAAPHASEELETETYRVADWLIARAVDASKPAPRRTEQNEESQESGEPDAEPARLPSSKPPGANDVVAFALTSAGDLVQRYRLRDLAEDGDDKRLKGRLNRELVGAILVVDARLGGLTAGLLDKLSAVEAPTADGGGDWLLPLADGGPVVRFVLHPPARPKSAKAHGRETYAFATRRSAEGEDEEVLVVETWTTEESRAVSRSDQTLAKHRSRAEAIALAIADAVGLTGDHRKALAIAARLHDEGKRATRWQQAFNAPHDGEVYAKTKGPINQSRLDGYRHEFGSLPYAEKDEEFRVLHPDLQGLVLHLIAAHHGFARPVIATKSCEDAPPSALKGRAGDVALRFARLQKLWGPWGLAWWESLLRAADQQASRDNDDGRKDAKGEEDA